MATGYQYGGALSKRRARRGYRVPMSEINVTPMVDVMLVLLIIFMVTAPLLTVGVDIGQDANLPEVALPQTEAGAVAPVEKALSITVDADGKIFLQDLRDRVRGVGAEAHGHQRDLRDRPGLGPGGRGDLLWRRRKGSGPHQGGGPPGHPPHRPDRSALICLKAGV